MTALDFSAPALRRGGEGNIVPMINVVFLLLIFFLMSARIAPPDPLPVALPQGAAVATAEGGLALYLGADGTLAYGDTLGAAALAALPPDAPVILRADAAAKASALARVMADLAARGLSDVALTVTGP